MGGSGDVTHGDRPLWDGGPWCWGADGDRSIGDKGTLGWRQMEMGVHREGAQGYSGRLGVPGDESRGDRATQPHCCQCQVSVQAGPPQLPQPGMQ